MENGMSKLDFGPIEQAHITQTEYAKILGVSRVTVANWVRGTEPSPFLGRAAQTLLDQIAEAVTEGRLPGELEHMVPTERTVEERLGIIRKALDDDDQ